MLFYSVVPKALYPIWQSPAPHVGELIDEIDDPQLFFVLVDTRLEMTFCREPIQSGSPKPGFLSREKVFRISVGKGIGVAPGIA